MIKWKWIVLGDLTTHGGEVISAHGQTINAKIDGKYIACIGDWAWCPKCKKKVQIMTGADGSDGGPRMIINGRFAAREDDKLTDGSRLMSRGQNIAVHVCDGTPKGVLVAQAGNNSAAAAAYLAASRKNPASEAQKTEVLRAEMMDVDWDKTIPVARDNKTIGEVSWLEEWGWFERKYPPIDANRPGAYRIKGKQPPRFKASVRILKNKNVSGNFKLRGELNGLRFESEAPVSIAEGTAVKDIPMKILNHPDSLQHYAGLSTWELAEEGGEERVYRVDKKPRLELYFLYDTPAEFFKKGVWLEALEKMFNGAKVQGLKDEDAISAEVTRYLHSGDNKMVYDTKKGATYFGTWLNGIKTFKLMLYIRRKDSGNTYNTVNCYDQAAAVQAFCGCLGVKVRLVELSPFGYINTTNLVGVGACNNPVYGDKTYPPGKEIDSKDPNYSRRSYFGKHVFIETASGYIRDACVGPHIATEPFRTYLENVIDIGTTLYDDKFFIASGGANTKGAYFDELVRRKKNHAGVSEVEWE
ncbi:MAG: PAAR domain-containing protein [Azoarcus sp.]|jgi:uncharacterized Zn-binding protein involved in type VI secretion|nr:PAAR domain-containing protein [Azoarcus sp.]